MSCHFGISQQYHYTPSHFFPWHIPIIIRVITHNFVKTGVPSALGNDHFVSTKIFCMASSL